MSELDVLRARIAALDEQLVATVNERLETVAALQRLKREQGLPPVDPAREDWLVDHLVQTSTGRLSAGAVARLARFVLDLTKEEALVA